VCGAVELAGWMGKLGVFRGFEGVGGLGGMGVRRGRVLDGLW